MLEGEPKQTEDRNISEEIAGIKRVPGRVWGLIAPENASLPQVLALSALDAVSLAGWGLLLTGQSYLSGADIPLALTLTAALTFPASVNFRIRIHSNKG